MSPDPEFGPENLTPRRAFRPSGKPLRVLVVDDNAPFRRGLRSVLATIPNLELVGEAANADEAAEMVSRLQPDLVILDVRMPGRSGVETLVQLRTQHPSMVVIIFTIFAYAQLGERCLELGADFFFDKVAGVDPLLAVLRRLAGNGGQPLAR